MIVNEIQTILHLSDLHFSTKYDEQTQTNRNLVLQGLLNVLSNIDKDWRPNLVCITGDIIDKGDVSGFTLAADWLQKLANNLQIGFDQFILCPGNHDGSRDVKICPPIVPNTADEADKILNIEIPNYLNNRFIDYSNFCKKLCIHPYSIGKYESYLIGNREINGIQFIVCNTAWFSFEQDETSKLWLGLNLLKYLEAKNQLVTYSPHKDQKLSIAIMHHGTETYFQEPERQNHDNRPPALHYLWKRCHLALYGHSHENAVGEPDKMQAHCWTVRAGATNAGANHPNNINLIRINDIGFELRRLDFSPSETKSPWKQEKPAQPFLWNECLEEIKEVSQKKFFCDQSLLRERAIKYANEIIENKSRQIKPYGNLPEQISLKVEVKPEIEFKELPQKSDTDKPRVLYLPIEEAIPKSRLTLLFGDLGSGKSTILAKLALTMGDQIPKCIPLFIPAFRLKTSIQDGITEMLDLLSNFIKSELTPGESFNIEDIINNGYEIILLIDGLDEIDKPSAICLFRLLTRLVMLYSRIIIVLSSRFTEMAGVDYDKWQVCQVPSITLEQKETLLRNEAFAQQKNHQEANLIARKAMDVLKANPLLDSIANSPLSVRLLFNSLTNDISIDQERTLGGLLYQLLLQRLGEWAEIDLKVSQTKEFESLFPTPEAKSLLLGKLAYKVFLGNVSKAEVSTFIEDYVTKNSQVSLISKQAITFFEINGIITSLDPITFVYQPLTQIAAGVYLSELILTNKIESTALNPSLWRIVSFAGTMIRRLNRVEDKREWFISYLKSLMKNRTGIAPACYVCSELRDELIAQKVVDILPNIGRRPLWYLNDERGASVMAIAHTLVLAGDKGFDWLFTEYLDPKIPPINAGSALITDLFKKWSILIKPRLTDSQKSRLSELIEPFLGIQALGTFGFIENIAYLVSEKFDLKQFLWLCANQLDSNDFGQWAKEQFEKYFQEGKEQVVNAILERKAGKEGSKLWLKLNSKKKPPLSIVKTILSANLDAVLNNDTHKALIDCQNRIGNDHWTPLLRWLLTDSDNKIAASAALELIKQGENSLHLLGKALVKGLNYSSSDSKIESVFKDLIFTAEKANMKWQNWLFIGTDQSIGANTCSWRIFLDTLNDEAENGPALLIEKIENIGPFNLSRYPDIRLAFRNLLSGPNGQAYRKALRNALDHFNPSVRHAAAMVLTTCYPDEEGLALVTVVSFIGINFEFWEWEKFLTTLNFGASVLEILKNSLPTFSGESRIMALTLLAYNNIPLQKDNKRELVLGCTDWRTHYIENLNLNECNLDSEFSRNLLLHELNNSSFKDSSQIAKTLLKYHSQNLTPDEKAKCYVATIETSTTSIRSLLSILSNDDEFTNAIYYLRKSAQLENIPQLLKEFIDDNGNLIINWNEILWSIFCSDKPFNDEDNAGLDLLWLGQEQSEIGKAIGQAAESLLDDERIQKYRWTNRYRWLGLLADEFIGLKKERLKEIICIGNSRYGSATLSLLRRLGEVPPNFDSKDNRNVVPTDLYTIESVSSDQIPKELMDAARESEWLKSGITNLITKTIYDIKISQNFLDELASKGTNGCLLAGVLAYCYNLNIKPTYALSFNDYFNTIGRTNSKDFERLKEVSTLSHAALIHFNSKAKDEYITTLLNSIEGEQYNKNYYIFEILDIQKQLTVEQACYLLPLFASNNYGNGYDRAIVSILSKWVSNLTNSNLRKELLHLSTKCINSIDRLSWSIDSLDSRDPSIYLYFPLMYWNLGGKPDCTSCRVFARGIKFIFENKTQRKEEVFKQFSVIQSVEPLLQCIPNHILKDALMKLIDFPVPEVRAYVKFFNCFIK